MRAPFALLACATLAACGLLGDGGTTYAVPAKEARATLLMTEAPLFLFGEGVADARVWRDGDDTVRWLLVDRQGTGLLTLVARTTVEDATHTRVTVAVEPPAGGKHDDVAKRLAENGSVVDFYKAAMEEQIDATFEKREFDMLAVQDEMMVAAFAMAPAMSRQMGEAAKASKARDKANIERAYEAEAQGHWPSDSSRYRPEEPAFGEPMDPATGSGD